MMNKIWTATCVGLLVSLALGAAPADEKKVTGTVEAKAAVTADDAATIAAQIPYYPLKECLVSGEALVEGEITDVVHEGRLLRLCCGMCKRQFEKDPASLLAKLDAAVVRAQKPLYPLENCVISDEALGSMGDPIEEVHQGRLVRLCCKGCVKSFHKNPAKYFAAVDRALIAKQAASYKLTTCPVSGEPLGDEPVDHLYGMHLVRTCCKRCAKAVDKEPAKYLRMVADAK